jgi:tetratricopeptide (TPR) repeat protein
MAEINGAGKSGVANQVVRAEEARKLPPAQAGAVPADLGIAKDELRFKKILWKPEDRARFRLNQAEQQIDRNLEAVDQAIAARTQGNSWIKQFNDPELQELRRARAELVKAKKDVAAAKQALDGTFPYWKMAQAYLGPDILRKQTPDLAEAEARLNSALGRLAKAEHCIQDAIDQGPDDLLLHKAEPKARDGESPAGNGAEKTTESKVEGKVEGDRVGGSAKCPGVWPGHTRDADLRRLLRDVRETRGQLESAREDIWEAQEQRKPTPWPPIHVDPPIWREPPIHKFPPTDKIPPVGTPPVDERTPIQKWPPVDTFPPAERPLDRDDRVYATTKAAQGEDQ